MLWQENDVRDAAAQLQWAPIVPAEQHEARKPLLRGWLHAAACGGAFTFTVLIIARSQPRTVPLAPLVYAVSMIELYAVSATFHLGTWRKPRHRVLRALDHASIFIAIASTFTPLCVAAAHGMGGIALLSGIWLLALAGVVITVRFPRVSRSQRTALYIGIGWCAAFLMPALWTALPHMAVSLLALGGLGYSAGSLVYLRRSPDPAPLVFGYHEVFHALVIVSNALCAIVVWYWIMPLS